MPNEGLTGARVNDNDEFYTLKSEIAKELIHYKDYFKNKIVYCNCDEFEKSNFWNFFRENFEEYGLKKLMCTYYNPDGEAMYWEYNGYQEIGCPLDGNGDYASEECLEIMDEADVVVTNPPFSLLKNFIPTVVNKGKKILVICNMNCVTCKDVFPLIRDNKLWAGNSFNKTMEFIMPDSYELEGKAFIDPEGRKHGFVPAICWLTNIDYPERFSNNNIEYSCKYSEDKYPKYDGFDAIEVSRIKNIPIDYDGVMGVPITSINKCDPKYFEIVGITNHGPMLGIEYKNNNYYAEINGIRKYCRVLVRWKRGNNE